MTLFSLSVTSEQVVCACVRAVCKPLIVKFIEKCMLYIKVKVQAMKRSGDQVLVDASFFAPVQTGSGVHPVFCTIDTGSLSRG
jgi:hypothetical protein